MRNPSGLTALLLTAAGAGALLAARAATSRTRSFDFRGKVVLITGGSRGLGLVLARALSKQGARLALCARDAEDLEAVRQELDAFTVPCDLRSQTQVDSMVSQVIAHFGQIDVLINNAGVMTVGPMETMTIEDYREAMDGNFW